MYDVPMYLVKDRHIAAIPREMYDSIQAEATRRAAKKNVSDKAMTERGKYSGKFALTSLLYCGECGSAYRRCTLDIKWTEAYRVEMCQPPRPWKEILQTFPHH